VSSSNRTISWKPPSHGGDGRVVDMIQVWTGLATKFWTLPGPGVSLKSCGVVWCETRHRQSCGVEKRTDGLFSHHLLQADYLQRPHGFVWKRSGRPGRPERTARWGLPERQKNTLEPSGANATRTRELLNTFFHPWIPERFSETFL
jgi:hypothetical protein